MVSKQESSLLQDQLCLKKSERLVQTLLDKVVPTRVTKRRTLLTQAQIISLIRELNTRMFQKRKFVKDKEEEALFILQACY